MGAKLISPKKAAQTKYEENKKGLVQEWVTFSLP